jgi:hypothetical protein
MDIGRFYETRPVITVMIGVVGGQSGQTVTTGRAFGDPIGCPPDALLARAPVNLIHGDSRSEVRDRFERAACRRRRGVNGFIRTIAPHGGLRRLSFQVAP